MIFYGCFELWSHLIDMFDRISRRGCFVGMVQTRLVNSTECLAQQFADGFSLFMKYSSYIQLPLHWIGCSDFYFSIKVDTFNNGSSTLVF